MEPEHREEHVLGCHRVSDLKTPRAGSIQRSCAKCGEAVWIQPANAALRLKILCLQCAVARAKEVDDTRIFPASEARRRFGELN